MRGVIRELGLTGRFCLIFVAVVLLIVATLGYYLLIQEEQALKLELKKKGVILAQEIAAHAVDPILQDDWWQLYSLLKALKGLGNWTDRKAGDIVVYGMILDDQGMVLAHTNPQEVKIGQPLPPTLINRKALVTEQTLIQELSTSKGDHLYDVAVPVESYGRRLGTVRLGITTRYLDAFLQKNRNRVLIFLSLISMLGIGMGIYLARRLTEPLNSLTNAAEAISKGDFPQRMPKPTGGREIRRLITAFQHMASTLKTKNDSLINQQRELERNNERLAAAIEELTNLKVNLEKEVDRRTEQLALSRREIEDSRNFLATILNNMGEGIVVIDRDYHIVAINPYALNMMRIREEEIKGRYCYQVFHGLDQICRPCPVQETFRTGKPQKGHRTKIMQDGSPLEIEVSSFPISDVDNRVYLVIKTLRDISLEKRLHEQDREIERLLTLSKLTMTITHQINNPLAIIKNYLCLIKNQLSADYVSLEYLNIINAEVDRIAHILRQLNTLQHIEARCPRWPVNINRIIEGTAKSWGRSYHLRLELDENLPPVNFPSEPLENILKFLLEAMEDGKERQELYVRSFITVDEKTKTQNVGISIGPLRGRGDLPLKKDPSQRLYLIDAHQRGLSDIRSLIAYEIIKKLGGSIIVEEVDDRDARICKILLPIEWD